MHWSLTRHDDDDDVATAATQYDNNTTNTVPAYPALLLVVASHLACRNGDAVGMHGHAASTQKTCHVKLLRATDTADNASWRCTNTRAITGCRAAVSWQPPVWWSNPTNGNAFRSTFYISPKGASACASLFKGTHWAERTKHYKQFQSIVDLPFDVIVVSQIVPLSLLLDVEENHHRRNKIHHLACGQIKYVVATVAPTIAVTPIPCAVAHSAVRPLLWGRIRTDCWARTCWWRGPLGRYARCLPLQARDIRCTEAVKKAKI